MEKDLALSDCLLLEELSVIEERDPVWFRSLSIHNVRNIILYEIRYQQTLVGFIWAVSNERCVYIFFLAIAEQYRGRGYGTQAIDGLFRFYSDRQVVLDFEELDPASENYAQRVRRKNFYLRCGFHETGRYTLLGGERFEVVCNGGALDAEGFLDLVLLIHELMPVYPGILL